MNIEALQNTCLQTSERFQIDVIGLRFSTAIGLIRAIDDKIASKRVLYPATRWRRMELTTGVCEANEVFVRPSIPSSLLTHGCYIEAAAFLLIQYHRLHLSLYYKK